MDALIYAGFWRRFLAFTIDAFFMLILSIPTAILLPIIGPVVITFLYRPIFESSELMATPGKMILGLKVLGISGNRLTLTQSLIRLFCSYLSILFLCLGYLISLFTLKRQTFHDLMAESIVVVRETPADTEWFVLWKKQVQEILKIKSIPVVITSDDNVDTQVSDVTKTLEQLHKLYSQGILTEEEYTNKKTELLKKI